MSFSARKLVSSLAILILVLGVLVACGGPEPTPQVIIATNTFTPQAEVAAATHTLAPPPTELPPTPVPSDTPSPEPPTATVQPSDTPEPEPPTNTPKPPTSTPKSAANTPKPPTDTPEPPTKTPKPPTKTPQVEYPAATLLAPEEKDAGSLYGQVTFRWSYPRQLAAGEAFQVLIWKEGQPHWGAAGLWTATEQIIDLDGVLPGRGGSGEYFWTVVVREQGTEKLLSPEASPWRLTFSPQQDACAACDCNQDCKQGTCEDCCQTCCGGCD